MNILKLTDGVPSKYSESRLKRDNPNVSFPRPLNDRVLADFDCYTYTIDAKPEYNPVLQNLNSVFEQRADNRIIRPSEEYIGPESAEWVDIENR